MVKEDRKGEREAETPTADLPRICPRVYSGCFVCSLKHIPELKLNPVGKDITRHEQKHVQSPSLHLSILDGFAVMTQTDLIKNLFQLDLVSALSSVLRRTTSLIKSISYGFANMGYSRSSVYATVCFVIVIRRATFVSECCFTTCLKVN